jgi:hypothetical protein
MSMRLGLDLESTELNGASLLSRTLRSVLPHKPWLHVPIGKPCLDPKAWLEGSTGHPWESVYFSVKPFDRDLADLVEHECNASKPNIIREAVLASPDSTAVTAQKVGRTERRVRQIKAEENAAYAGKTSALPRKEIAYKINSGTKPSTAAEKIHATFGPDFAQALKAAL